ncbi:MAG: diaminopimelate epimerase, partial [Candidatus Coproplasma sp.]
VDLSYQSKFTDATKVKLGKNHFVTFCDRVDDVDFEELSQELSANCKEFADCTFLECVRVVNNVTVRMRVWSKINGETWSCGTAAAAAAIAAIKKGDCAGDQTITVKLKGGDLFIKSDRDGNVELDGPVKEAFKGIIEI